ncbi:hypothetical protein Rhal01_03535 [Rubritalea halochordaticola]|uniref:Uncharacterized protein n=1 Tax=Rubritalea halochordaticola TaxID=714537 RepID=A0ABP9V7K3_9BACT
MMKTLNVITLILCFLVCAASAQSKKPLVTFEQMFTPAQQKSMGLSKLTAAEKEALRAHVESMLVRVASAEKKTPVAPGGRGAAGKVYAGVGGGHWIKKNIERGTYILLEDRSLWQIDPLDKINASLWLSISNITVVESNAGSPGYNYLLINTDDGEKAHAKYLGKQ